MKNIYLRLGKEVEIRCLQIFVRALTKDINEYEVKLLYYW